MTIEEFQELVDNEKILIAYCSHEECNVCKVLRPKVEMLANKTQDADYLYVNIKESPAIAGQFLIFAVPTIIIFLKGKEAQRFSRHFSMADFESSLQKLLSII